MGIDRPNRVAYPYLVAPPVRMILGHPSGLFTLFLTEMGERFSFYGIRAILLVFLVDSPAHGGLGLATATAAALYSIYQVTVYLLAMPGGWVADRLTGTRRAVLVGGIVIAAGHGVMILPPGPTTYLGLVLIAVGSGLLRPNIAALVGQLYDRLPDANPGRRDSGFSLFYLGVNAGAVGGALLTGWLGLRYGWSVGFGVAAVGTTVALIQFLAAGRSLGGVGLAPHRPLDEYRRGLILRRAAGAGAAGVAGLAIGSVVLAAASGRAVLEVLMLLMPPIVLAVPVVFFAIVLREHTLTRPERSRVHAFIPIFLAATVFWLVFDQAGRLVQLFAAERVDNLVPLSWYESVNPLLVLAFAPLFALLWAWLGERAFSTPAKVATGLLGIGGSAVLLLVAGLAARDGRISPLWLLGIVVVQTLAELFLAPIGLSVTTRLAPKRFASQLMGLWLLAVAVGIALGSYLVRLNAHLGDTVYIGLLGGLAIVVGLAFLLSAPRIRSLMAGVD